MILNLRGKEDLGAGSPPVSRFAKLVVSILLTLELVFIIKGVAFSRTIQTGITAEIPDGFGSVEQVATLLFGRYLYPFELTSVLLLAAIVGAVVIARRERSGDVIPDKNAPSNAEGTE
jgi:NADH-quinone oxidoreductase subunit J